MEVAGGGDGARAYNGLRCLPSRLSARTSRPRLSARTSRPRYRARALRASPTSEPRARAPRPARTAPVNIAEREAAMAQRIYLIEDDTALRTELDALGAMLG